MATQQDKKKPVTAKKAAASAKQAAIAKQLANPVEQQQDIEARRTRLKTLIVLGKERGYLTYPKSTTIYPRCWKSSRSKASSA